MNRRWPHPLEASPMKPIPNRRPRAKRQGGRAGVTWVLLAAFVATGPTGCASQFPLTSWKTEPASPESLLARKEPPRQVRLKLADGSMVEFRSPSVRGDSLHGKTSVTIVHQGRWPVQSRWVETRTVDGAAVLSDIRVVEVQKEDAGKSLLYFAATLGATIILARAAAGLFAPDFSKMRLPL